MNLIEHKYMPTKINDIIITNKNEILQKINNYTKNNQLNLLIISSHYTLKNILSTQC